MFLFFSIFFSLLFFYLLNEFCNTLLWMNYDAILTFHFHLPPITRLIILWSYIHITNINLSDLTLMIFCICSSVTLSLLRSWTSCSSLDISNFSSWIRCWLLYNTLPGCKVHFTWWAGRGIYCTFLQSPTFDIHFSSAYIDAGFRSY